MSADRDAGLLDSEVSAGLRAGDLSVLHTLLHRDYALTVYFVRALAPDADAVQVVGQVWERVVADALAGRVSGDLRVALLGHLSALIPEPLRAQAVAVTPLGTFEGADDLSREDPLARISRWEHWWDDEPPTWPPGRKPRPDEVLAALGRLDFHLRRLLILRDVARLSAEEARMITGSDEDASEVPLQLARDAYVVELDREIGGR